MDGVLRPVLQAPDSDLDLSFTSIASSSSCSTATTLTSSARSSLSLPFDPRFSISSSLLHPRPHSRCVDPRWAAVRAAAALSPDGTLHLHHLQILAQLGSGHLARVFHCRLADHPTSPDFALKVVDVDALSRLKNAEERLAHVRTEGRVLAALDHPFLPTLYAQLDAPPRYTCFLLDYCSGGDLHSLLRRQPGGRLPLQAARFIAAEVLIALEYLHAAGFVYRDLKPENVLLRGDGHVVLSDFDLCLPSHVLPALSTTTHDTTGTSTSSTRIRRRKRRRRVLHHTGCSCFGGGGGGVVVDVEEEGNTTSTTTSMMEFVARPEGWSRECVGTHEYLAPEVAAGEAHGAEVDWWALGVFVYELLYGRTPFRGRTKDSTLRNILSLPLRFPPVDPESDTDADSSARELIERLLDRDPRRRLGSARGAAEVKRHPFFRGVDWPLIRSSPGLGAGAGGDKRDSSWWADVTERRRRRRRHRQRQRGWWWPWKPWRSAANHDIINSDDGTHRDHIKTVINGYKEQVLGVVSATTGTGNGTSSSHKRMTVSSSSSTVQGRVGKRTSAASSSSMNGWFD